MSSAFGSCSTARCDEDLMPPYSDRSSWRRTSIRVISGSPCAAPYSSNSPSASLDRSSDGDTRDDDDDPVGLVRLDCCDECDFPPGDVSDETLCPPPIDDPLATREPREPFATSSPLSEAHDGDRGGGGASGAAAASPPSMTQHLWNPKDTASDAACDAECPCVLTKTIVLRGLGGAAPNRAAHPPSTPFPPPYLPRVLEAAHDVVAGAGALRGAHLLRASDVHDEALHGLAVRQEPKRGRRQPRVRSSMPQRREVGAPRPARARAAAVAPVLVRLLLRAKDADGPRDQGEAHRGREASADVRDVHDASRVVVVFVFARSSVEGFLPPTTFARGMICAAAASFPRGVVRATATESLAGRRRRLAECSFRER
eukprot:22875-Pelagococcus_subviridis.AAC.4